LSRETWAWRASAKEIIRGENKGSQKTVISFGILITSHWYMKMKKVTQGERPTLQREKKLPNDSIATTKRIGLKVAFSGITRGGKKPPGGRCVRGDSAFSSSKKFLVLQIAKGNLRPLQPDPMRFSGEKSSARKTLPQLFHLRKGKEYLPRESGGTTKRE